MDYIEAFKNLRANNKYGRKSPHKAVMMLTVIQLFEKGILTENEIYYDKQLKSMFLKVWNRVLPDEPLFHPDAYLPFWYLQSDSFWHIVPIRGKEEILALMRDVNIKPSEKKLSDSVRCVELDEDLYFLMTIASGRSSLKRALLETYFHLSEKQINKMSESIDNTVDHFAEALSEYESILSKSNNDIKAPIADKELIDQFHTLSEDLQITLNLEYFSFLKKHRIERELMKDICPSVYSLFDKIYNHPIKKGEIAPSFAFAYENFLADLRITLMSENDSMKLIDKVNSALEALRGIHAEYDTMDVEGNVDTTNVEQEQEIIPKMDKENFDDDMEIEHVYLDKSGHIVNTISSSLLKIQQKKNDVVENRMGKAWTQKEEEMIKHYFQQGLDTATIADMMGRTDVAIKARLAKLGLIEYTYNKDEATAKPVSNGSLSKDGFKIENLSNRCYILTDSDKRVFTADGKLKYIGGNLYQLILKDSCFTVKRMLYNHEIWMKGDKKIVAYPNTPLYKSLENTKDLCSVIEDIVDSPSYNKCRLKVNGEWYNYKGDLISEESPKRVGEINNLKETESISRILMNPLYAVRKQAVLRALGLFKLPANIKDVARAISRTAWGKAIKESDVEAIINTISEIGCVDGRYFLRKE